MFASFGGNAATNHGNEGEILCCNLLSAKYESSFIRNFGLFINIHYPWLGYSPDGIVITGGRVYLIEIKSPTCGKKIPAELFNAKNVKCLTMEGENLVLKRRHRYYGQIQLGLFLLGLNHSRLLLYSEKSNSYLKIEVPYDYAFCKTFIVSLTSLYFSKFLPFVWEKKRVQIQKVSQLSQV